ncbi:hypothetical protein ABLV94_13150 [Staphylococcus sp. Mo2-7]|uniref:hypothetical protein n=1 Tax=Staphylococcus sp. Mo2-6 TaxID=3135641 RepID=UPI003368159D
MKYLFDSKGNHIANVINDNLFSVKGINIGHCVTDLNIFIDIYGKYIGEIIYEDRLMYNKSSPFKNKKFGIYGETSNGGIYGIPRGRHSIGNITGYTDTNLERLIFLKDL